MSQFWQINQHQVFLVVIDETYLKTLVQINLSGAQAKNSNLTQMKYFCEAKIFWLGLGLSF